MWGQEPDKVLGLCSPRWGGLDSLEELWHPSNKITIKRVEPPVGTDGEQIGVQAG